MVHNDIWVRKMSSYNFVRKCFLNNRPCDDIPEQHGTYAIMRFYKKINMVKLRGNYRLRSVSLSKTAVLLQGVNST